LIVAALPLADQLARAYRDEGLPYGELVRISWLGVVIAADCHAYGHEPEFLRFAEQVIRSELDRFAEDPTLDFEREQEVALAERRVGDVLAGQDRMKELARYLDVDVEAVVDGLMDVVGDERLHVLLGHRA
jgi:DNA-directed RNA polymerase specialized sigma subunit